MTEILNLTPHQTPANNQSNIKRKLSQQIASWWLLLWNQDITNKNNALVHHQRRTSWEKNCVWKEMDAKLAFCYLASAFSNTSSTTDWKKQRLVCTSSQISVCGYARTASKVQAAALWKTAASRTQRMGVKFWSPCLAGAMQSKDRGELKTLTRDF